MLMSFNLFLPLFVNIKKVHRQCDEKRRNRRDQRLPLDVSSPLIGAPRDRSYNNLLQNKVRGTRRRKCSNISTNNRTSIIHSFIVELRLHSIKKTKFKLLLQLHVVIQCKLTTCWFVNFNLMRGTRFEH